MTDGTTYSGYDERLSLTRIVHADGPDVDAFFRRRTSEPVGMFDSKLIRGKEETLFWQTILTSGGSSSFVANNAAVDLTVTGTVGSKVTRQTREYFNYQAGRSQCAFFTFVMSEGANRVQRIGLFDDANGIFLENRDGVASFVIRSSTSGTPVETRVPSSEWNQDKLNGKGYSRTTFNPTDPHIQLLFIDFAWLSAGRVRLGFFIEGVPIICHEFNHANLISAPYISTPNLPVRYEIETISTAAASASLRAICCAVFSEGGHDYQGLEMSVNRGDSGKTAANGVRTPFLAVRHKSAHPRISVSAQKFTVMTKSAQRLLAELWLIRGEYAVAALTGPSWTAAHAESSCDYDIAATAFDIANAVRIDQTYVSNQDRSAQPSTSRRYKLLSTVDGTSDFLVLTIMGVGGNATNTYAGISWIEEL